jgi:predicted alpha/beta-hydrolase family hydrolase
VSPARREPKTAAEPESVATPAGPAAVIVDRPGGTINGLLVLGHGAGGGVDAPDLLAARAAALAAHWAVARVLQPYRVAGRKAPAPAAQLDSAFLTVLAALRKRRGMAELSLVVGGRSSGARVACRTAADAGARGVLALAFPLHPPGRPERTRAEELLDVGVPVVVVQGDRDAFGTASDIAALDITGVQVQAASASDHALRSAAARSVIADVVTTLLASVRP